MAVTVAHFPVNLGRLLPPRLSFRFRLLREGEATVGLKNLMFYRSFDTMSVAVLGFSTLDGEYTNYVEVLQSAILAQESWLVVGLDDAPPKKIRAAYLGIDAGGTYTFNITSGEGGASGEPATVQALVRVDGVAANREVVLVERPIDGEWRLAGYGQAPGGSGQIDARVVGGSVFAVAVDDFGIAFSGGLAVTAGQRVRPSVFTGVLYQVTEAGVLPATEPEWWPITSGGSRELGTARAEAVRYYRPLAHGPVTAELT